jgi:hypothetical protein
VLEVVIERFVVVVVVVRDVVKDVVKLGVDNNTVLVLVIVFVPRIETILIIVTVPVVIVS